MPSQYLRLALGLIFLQLSARIPSGSANVAKILSMFFAAKSTRIGQSESRQREVNSVKVKSVEVNSVEVNCVEANSVEANSVEANSVEVKKPHIFIILADDLGWNDLSFHGANQIPTPNIDALAYNGVILNSHYVSSLCTPSRAALMTGKYPIRTGMQHYVLFNSEPRGLPLNEKLLPEYMRDAGYRTHAIGKWHLGFHKREYTPTYRGFDSHFGYWTAFQDYYSHQVFYKLPKASGIDMRRNMSVAWDTEGKYSTDLFTEEAIRIIEEHDTRSPMFMYLAHLAVHVANTPNPRYAPDDEIAKFSYIEDPGRRTYAAMVSKMDASVGAVTEALSRRGMLNNSIILFMSDNGAQPIGPYANNGSNYPLRGMKNGAWEGGVRGAAAIWSPLIKNPRRVSNQLMSITDWLPTFWSAAGSSVILLPLLSMMLKDGQFFNNLLGGERVRYGRQRSGVLINIDDKSEYSAIRRGDFKYVFGQADTNNDWYGDSGRNDTNQSSLSESYLKSVLSSEAGVAISRLTTSGQMMKSQNQSNDDSVKILTTDDIRRLRFDAEIRCNRSEKWKKVICDPVKSPCLFNIKEDPCEYVNLAKNNPTILDTLEDVLEKYRATAIPEANLPTDPLPNPDLWGGVWVNWKDSDPLVINTKNN